MTQISRPFQVALAAVGVLALVWLVALRGHSSSSEPTAGAPASHLSPSPSSGGGSSSGSVYHGSAPGVEGLTRDIQKAHGAVAASEQNAAQLERKSAQASSESSSTGGTSAASGSTAAATPVSKHASATKTAASAKAKAPASKHSATPSSGAHARSLGLPAGQVWVEGELAHKLAVALLFYSPRAYDDSRTRREVENVVREERAHHRRLVLRVAPANAVGTFGSFTRVASVYQTPTLLLVMPNGEVKPPITGLTDGFSIAQAINEKTQP
jgi:hypothetical protein